MASELRCPPLAFGNSAVASHLLGSLLQPRKIRAVRLQNGVTRCLRPFPVTSTCAPAVTVICSRVNPLISETRKPGLHREQEQGVVTTTIPGALVRRGK